MHSEPARRSSVRARALTLAAALVAVGVHQWWTWSSARWLTALSFGGDAERVRNISSRYDDGDHFVGQLWITMLLLLIAGEFVAWSLREWWPYGWRSATHRGVQRVMPLLPVAAIVAGMFETVLSTFWVDDVGGALEATDGEAAIIATFGQLKWLALFVSGFALFLTLYGAIRFRRLAFDPAAPTAVVQHGPPLTTPSEGSAICLSGGGIRAAAFAWGALAELERHRPIEQFDRLYSVSGGGYAAAAYTGADASLRDDSRFFSDAQLASDDGETVDNARYDFVRRHRAYLANGRGGLVRAVMLALGSVLLNLVVIFLGVVVIAVPVGVLARNELGNSGEAFVAAVGWPVVVTAVLAVVALLLSAAVDHEPPRRALTASGVFLAAAVALGVIRVGLPWLAVNSDSLMSGAWWRNVLPAAVLWIGSLLFAILRPRLSKVAIRLGGLISAAAIVFASIFVTRITIDDTRHWALDRSFLDDARWLLPICVVLLVLVDYSGVQWWSLHPLYRDRLAGTFLMKPKGDGLAAQHCDDWATWCDLQDRPKPVHVVCAATHRRESDVTGLRSTSFTFSRDGVDMHEPERDADTGEVRVNHYHRDIGWFDNALKINRRVSRPHKRSSVIAAAAMSGAAFNSAMGRHSKGSTDSLLAVLNLRLGVWLPNPRFTSVSAGVETAFTRPGLRYLFHEVVGHFDTSDPFIHVSDGGHWENLGLVEALRQRHRHIVVVDASGDHFETATGSAPGKGLGTLYEAVDLARMELHTEVRIDSTEFETMRPNHRTGRCTQNWMQCDIVYHYDAQHRWNTECDERCSTGTMLFVKALISDRTPESVLSFANTDRVFPNYSTGDQFLGDDQFRSLVGLGEAAMRDALVNVGDEWFTTAPSSASLLNWQRLVQGAP